MWQQIAYEIRYENLAVFCRKRVKEICEMLKNMAIFKYIVISIKTHHLCEQAVAF
jgi:muconolactone delta-isomerase